MQITDYQRPNKDAAIETIIGDIRSNIVPTEASVPAEADAVFAKKIFQVFFQNSEKEYNNVRIVEILCAAAGEKDGALREALMDPNNIGLIWAYVMKTEDEQHILTLNVNKVLLDDGHFEIQLELGAALRDTNDMYTATLLKFSGHDMSFGGSFTVGTITGSRTEKEEAAKELENEMKKDKTTRPDISDPNVRDQLLLGLFGTANPAITHIRRYLEEHHEREKTPSYMASMKTVPTETTIVFTVFPNDLTISIMKMKEGRFYRMYVAYTDLSLENPAYSATRHIEGRWYPLGRDVQNTELQQFRGNNRYR